MIGRLDRLGRVQHRRRCEQFAGAPDVGPALGAGEQAIVADAVEPLRQDVQQKATDKLVDGERHGAAALGAVASVARAS